MKSNPLNPFNSKLYISTNDGIHLFNINDILRIEASSNYCNIYLNDNSEHLVTKSLKHFEDKLPSTSFLRIHKSHIIRLKAITFIGVNNVRLLNQFDVPLSKTYKPILSELLKDIK